MTDRVASDESICESIESVREAKRILERVRARLDAEEGFEAQEYRGEVGNTIKMARELESLLRTYAPTTDEPPDK